MDVEVNLFAYLRKRAGGQRRDSLRVSIPTGSKVSDLMRLTHVSEADAKIVVVNGRHAGFDTELHDGDKVDIFPPVAGG